MPTLSRLALTAFRNIDEANLSLSSGFNLIYGNNGSGKTSLLEAIYLLCMGRSFRSHLQKPLIAHHQTQATVFGETIEGLTIGVQRPQKGAQIIKLAGKPAESLAQLSRALPVQLINSDTFQLLEGSPNGRRQFLDWGVFHVEHSFLEYWRRARQALNQRNALLRADAGISEIEPWSQELAVSAVKMDECRQQYLQQLQPLIEQRLNDIGMPGGKPVSLIYGRGWDEAADLGKLLAENLERDRRYSFTTIGPHKAELKFHINDRPVAEVLSRGQLKLLICLLKVAQAQLLREMTEVDCLFLLDDLPAELDSENRAKVCRMLAELKCQTFMTSIEQEQLSAIAQTQAQQREVPMTMFHVKHGKIVAV